MNPWEWEKMDYQFRETRFAYGAVNQRPGMLVGDYKFFINQFYNDKPVAKFTARRKQKN